METEKRRRVCIVGAARTPQGSFGGCLASLSASKLGSIAIRGALERSGVAAESVEEVFLGNVVQANQGQHPARQSSLGAGIPVDVPCTTVNKMCASGAKAVMFGCMSIASGDSDVIVAGGFESMSNAPFYSAHTRFGHRFGDVALVDGLQRDGLSCAYSEEAMGCSAALCSVEQNISREKQDHFAALSYARSVENTRNGALSREIVPVEVKGKRGRVDVVEHDEEPMLREVTYETLSKLPPAFKMPKSAHASPEKMNSQHKDAVTAGNSSVISDGASAIVLVSETFAKKHSLKILAFIDSWADSGNDPEHFTTSPAKAAHKALKKAGKSVHDIDLFEINEAFAVVTLANMKILGLTEDRVNVLGGAVSCGHAIGNSGCRILVTLLTALELQGKISGCATICNGGGGASSLILTRPNTSNVPSKL